MIPRIALTAGEPAGIGPDLVAAIAARDWPAEIVTIGDPQLLAERARALGIPLQIEPYRREAAASRARAGHLRVDPVPLQVPSRAGHPDPGNAAFVVETLRRAALGCLDGEFAALVTAPVHKGLINEAGIPFSGHTEFFAELTGSSCPVMMLVAGTLRVALATTHLPLREVPDRITRRHLEAVITVMHESLSGQFGIAAPRIAVLGLNPHAGESGHLGSEEREVIEPVLATLRDRGLHLAGPLPADSAFTRERLAQCDAVLAMYHDQGLPVLKYAGFGGAVNVTLGLPIVRTSVDHGTALELAGTGRASAGSLVSAIELALDLASGRSR